MTFNDSAQLDTSQVQDGGSSGGFGGGGGGGGSFPGGIQVGGGLLGLIVLILGLIFGGGSLGSGGLGDNPVQSTQLDASQVAGAGQSSNLPIGECKTGADANKNDTCLIVATVNSVQSYWTTTLPKYGMNYEPTKTVIYSGATQTACGTASNQVGPFYCPLDKKIYIDAAFFDLLQQRFGANGGQLAKEYVIAHEYGHSIQDQLGILDRAQQGGQGPNSGSVKIELMADCFAGTWVKHATETTDANGTPLMQPVTEADINSALSAASAVGDDSIQEKMQGRVTPENWTHGSSAARQRWFMTGYTTGDINACNTFSGANVE